MRNSILILAAGISFAAAPFSAVLAETPATAPTTQPTAADEQTKVLVLPFAPALATDADWISRAVQQSVVADLSRPTTGRPVQAVSDNTAINNTNDAIEAGKKAGAKYVVFGNYQTVEPTLKVTGQIIDVETGKVVSGLKSTGSVRDLFDMQDRLAAQVRFAIATERLTGRPAQVANSQPKLPVAPPPTIEAQGPVVVGDKHPFDGSDLSRAVADDVSLIDRYDATGQSYRQQYYDDRYYNSNLPVYSSYPYYGGGYYGYGGGMFGPFLPLTCRPLLDRPRYHHRDERSDLSPAVTEPTPTPPQQGVGAAVPYHLNGSTPMSMDSGNVNGNYANAPRNSVTPQFGNYNAPQFNNQNRVQYRNYNDSQFRNYNTGPANTVQAPPSNNRAPANAVQAPPTGARAPSNVVNAPRSGAAASK